MFDIEEDIDKKFQTSLIDDVQNSDKTYKIQLNFMMQVEPCRWYLTMANLRFW